MTMVCDRLSTHTFTYSCAAGAYPRLAPLAIVQGTLYSVALAIELFGIFSASSVSRFCNDLSPGLTTTLQQRARVVRLYAFLSAIAGLFVVSVGLMRIITHFTYKVN